MEYLVGSSRCGMYVSDDDDDLCSRRGHVSDEMSRKWGTGPRAFLGECRRLFA